MLIVYYIVASYHEVDRLLDFFSRNFKCKAISRREIVLDNLTVQIIKYRYACLRGTTPNLIFYQPEILCDDLQRNFEMFINEGTHICTYNLIRMFY